MLYKSENRKIKIPFYTPFVEQRKDIDQSSASYSIKAPFELVHADVADIQFFSKLALDPKYCLLAVGLFTSKIYVYPMKSRNRLVRKLELFYRDFQPTRDLRLPSNSEFLQDEIKKLRKKYIIEMFSDRACGGKGYTTEQKLREFKKLLFRSKQLHKATSTKLFNSRKLIRKAAENMNSINSQKYGYATNVIEAKAVESEKFRNIYVFYRLVKVKQHAERYELTDVEKI